MLHLAVEKVFVTKKFLHLCQPRTETNPYICQIQESQRGFWVLSFVFVNFNGQCVKIFLGLLGGLENK